MVDMDDTLTALNRLEKAIEGQRNLLLQAHGVLTCLHEVLLYADCDDAVSYAQAPLLDALAPSNKVDERRIMYAT